MARRTYSFTKKELTFRSTIAITEDMRVVLQEISKRCKKESGRWMDRSQILRSLITLLMERQGQVAFKGVRTEADLVQSFLKAFSKKK